MSKQTIDKSAAADAFGAITKKHRGLLTREERHLVALGKAADQAKLELANAVAVARSASERIAPLEEKAALAVKEFEAAQEALFKGKEAN